MIRWVAYFLSVTLGISPSGIVSLMPIYTLIAPGHLEQAVFGVGSQVVVLSSETSRSSSTQMPCLLSLWSIQQKKWLARKPVEALAPSGSCGRLVYSSFLQRLVIEAQSELLLVSPQTLETEKKISVTPNHIAAIDEVDGILYTLSGPDDGPVALTSYRLSSGDLVQRSTLHGLGYRPGTTLRVAAVSAGKVAVLESDIKPLGVSENKSTLAVCTQGSERVCNSVQLPMPVANFVVSGEFAFFVSDEFADHGIESRHQCVAKLPLDSLEISAQAYCRTDAGVHYSVGILDSSFILGYSGYGARRGWLDDGLAVSKSSSISVWDAQSARLIAIAPLPHGKSFTLSASAIRVDTSGEKRFLFYNPMEGNEVLIYDLSSLD
jgi:hypothetical protein